MSEIDKPVGDAVDEITPRERKVPLAMERFMRVYGGNFIRAFEALELAHTLLDVGSAAEAATVARAAAYHLTDPSRENDRGRDQMEVVREIARHFPTTVPAFPEGVGVHPAFATEIQIRLGVSTPEAIALGNRYNGYDPSTLKQLDHKHASPEPIELPSREVLELEVRHDGSENDPE